MHTHVPSNYHFIGTDLIGEIRSWLRSSPLFTRFVMGLCGIICIFGLFGDLPLFLSNIPKKTLGEFEITRLIFSPFTFLTLAEMFFGFIAYLPICAEQEKSSGTVKVTVDFLFKNLEINLWFIIICYLFSIIHPIFLTFSCYGLWGVFFVHVTEDCLKDPQGNIKILMSPIQVKTKYYPIILMIIFSIVSNAIRFDILVSIFVGYLHHLILNTYYLEFLNERKLADWEESPLLLWISTLPRFISVRNMSKGLIDTSNTQAGEPPQNFTNKSYGQVGNLEDQQH